MRLALAAILFCWLRALLLPLVMLLRHGRNYVTFNALAEDQAWNALLSGWPDEAVSARAWREKRTGWVRFINWLFSDPNHCLHAYESELARLQSPPEVRQS